MTPFLRTIVVAACLASICPAAAQAGPVTLTLNGGTVTLRAQNATARQILSEWARVGKVTIVNLERLPGGPMTLELTDMPEARALDIVLRSIAGYVAAPRAVRDAQASQFDRIFVMPTMAPPASAGASVGATRPGPPQMQQPQPFRPQGPGAEAMQNRRRGGELAGESPDLADLNDERHDEADEQRGMGRPPLGMRQPGEVAGGGGEAAGGAAVPVQTLERPGVPVTPGMTVPASAAKPGQVVPAPPKPPGDIK